MSAANSLIWDCKKLARLVPKISNNCCAIASVVAS